MRHLNYFRCYFVKGEWVMYGWGKVWICHSLAECIQEATAYEYMIETGMTLLIEGHIDFMSKWNEATKDI